MAMKKEKKGAGRKAKARRGSAAKPKRNAAKRRNMNFGIGGGGKVPGKGGK